MGQSVKNMGEKKELKREQLEIKKGSLVVDRLEEERSEIILGEGESLTIFLLPKAPKLSKTLSVYLRGNGSRVEILGALAFKRDEQSRLVVKVIHQGVSTSAYTHVRAVLFDESRASFSGMIRIEKGANKTSSLLENRVLILGEGARSESVPSLEIEADDVKASHAATTGKLSQDQLFYLQSRGIDTKTAVRMLLEGFFEPILTRVKDEKAAAQIRGELWTDVLRLGGESE